MKQHARLIIRCPDCEEKGFKQNLAEVVEKGFISIQRIRTGKHDGNFREHTIISGDNIRIICGNCGNLVYKKV